MGNSYPSSLTAVAVHTLADPSYDIRPVTMATGISRTTWNFAKLVEQMGYALTYTKLHENEILH